MGSVITLPNGISIESDGGYDDDLYISEEAYGVLDTYSVESIFEAASLIALEASVSYDDTPEYHAGQGSVARDLRNVGFGLAGTGAGIYGMNKLLKQKAADYAAKKRGRYAWGVGLRSAVGGLASGAATGAAGGLVAGPAGSILGAVGGGAAGALSGAISGHKKYKNELKKAAVADSVRRNMKKIGVGVAGAGVAAGLYGAAKGVSSLARRRIAEARRRREEVQNN